MSHDDAFENNPQDGDAMSRRRFFVVIGNSAVAVATLGGLGVTFDYLYPKVLLEVPMRFQVGRIDNVQPDSVVFDPEHRVFLFREAKGYCYALSAVCTHLGCTAAWKPGGIPGHPEGVIACPCHGSVFSKTGDVIRGPAARPLDRFRTMLEEGMLIVDTGEKVDEEEMILKV